MPDLSPRKFLFVLLIVVSITTKCQQEKVDTRKNVLFIAVDDLRPQLNCYGETQMQTPAIDKLAEQGLLFERAYCQQAICSPSRISLLTGLRCETTKIYGLEYLKKDKLPEITSLPAHFKNNGYKTISIGKIYHHKEDDPEAWSKSPFRAMKGSGYVMAESQAIVELNQKINPNAGTKGPVSEAADVPDNEYSDGKLADQAIEELKAMKGEPFFLALGFRKPHLPFTAPKKYWDLYHPDQLKLAENNFPPEEATRYTLSNYGELRKYYDMPKGKQRVEQDLARHLIHGYYACVSYIDAQIDRVVRELDRLGLRQNTIIILWGDHGWKLGEHDSWCKHTNFEVDCRAPLIISDPQFGAKGFKTMALTEFIDIYPTLCDLTGLPKPDHLEGRSFMPLIKNPDLEWKEAAYSIWVHKKYRYDFEDQIIGYAMKTDRYRYIEWRHTKSGEVRARELYDHQTDPQENVNVVARPEYAKTVANLEKKMKEEAKD